DHDPTLGQFVGEGPDRDVGLLCDALHQPVTLSFEDRPAVAPHLAGRETAGRTIAAHQLDRRRLAHIEPGGGSTAGCPRLDGGDDATTKVKIEWFGHGCWPPQPASILNHCSTQMGIPNRVSQT